MLPDPLPRIRPGYYRPYVWPVGEMRRLATRSSALDIDLVSLLELRETRREFSRPTDEGLLGEFLWLACRNRSSRPSVYGPNQETRTAPSAGGMHPIHVLISRSGSPWMRYDPVEHALVDIPLSALSATAARKAAGELIAVGQGVLIGLVAEPGKTAAKYENHESLVWRDAGVALGYMSIVAEALGLAFCPLGITGAPFLTDFLPVGTPIKAAGMAVVGKT